MLYGVDAVHGHNNVPGATIFPHQIGLGAAADPDLVERIGRATAVEMAATGIRWDFGPVVAVPQDVRWGRTYEGYGEDPIAVSDLASAFIRGMQGTDLSAPDSAIATAKHYVGDGGTTFGSSTTPGYLIDQGVVTDLDEETFRAIHLTPYEAAVDAGVRVVMASFSGTSAGKVHGDHRLITELLKGELGFTGFVVSDWGGIDQVDPDYDAAVARAITAGIDMAMVPYDGRRFQDAVRHGLTSGDILEGRVDDAVRRILRVKFEMGLFEDADAACRIASRPSGPMPTARSAARPWPVTGPAQDRSRPPAARPGRWDRPAGRARRGRHRPAVGGLDDLVAGEPRRHHARDDDRGGSGGSARRPALVRRRRTLPGGHPGEDRDRRRRRATVRRGRRRFIDARVARGGPRRCHAGPSARRSAHRHRVIGAACDARRGPPVGRCADRGVAPRHGRRRRRRRPPGRRTIPRYHAGTRGR